jgi:hypothetical protein
VTVGVRRRIRNGIVWSPDLPELYLFRSWKRAETGTDAVMALVKQWEDELGGFVAKVADTGGGGKLTTEDIRKRYGITFEPAKKTEKFHFAQMLNDDLRAGRIKVFRNSPLAQEWAVLPKDPDDPMSEDPRFDNHCSDAALYSWRKARHYWFEAAPQPPPPGTPEALEAEAEATEAALDRQLKREESLPWYEQ